MGGAASIEALPRLDSAERTYLVEWAGQTGLTQAEGILQAASYLTPLGNGMWEGMPAALGAEFDSAGSIIDHVEKQVAT